MVAKGAKKDAKKRRCSPAGWTPEKQSSPRLNGVDRMEPFHQPVRDGTNGIKAFLCTQKCLHYEASYDQALPSALTFCTIYSYHFYASQKKTQPIHRFILC